MIIWKTKASVRILLNTNPNSNIQRLKLYNWGLMEPLIFNGITIHLFMFQVNCTPKDKKRKRKVSRIPIRLWTYRRLRPPPAYRGIVG